MPMSDEMPPVNDSSQSPFFSVVTPTYNRSSLLRRALKSVQRQDFQDFEAIVVDDGSTEDVAAVAREILPAVKVVRLEKNSGIPKARNAGLRAARGRYIAYLDSDDVWHPKYLQFQHGAFQAVPDAIFVFSNYFAQGPRFGGPVRQLAPEPEAENALLHMIMRPFVHTMSSVVFPRSALLLADGFKENYLRFDDLDMFVRLLAGRRRERGLACLERPVPNLPHFLVLKTIHIEERTLEEYVADWDAHRRRFFDQVFSYDFMAPYGHLRRRCEARLREEQERLFLNFADMTNVAG